MESRNNEQKYNEIFRDLCQTINEASIIDFALHMLPSRERKETNNPLENLILRNIE